MNASQVANYPKLNADNRDMDQNTILLPWEVTYPYRDRSLQSSLFAYTGDAQCLARGPHSAWDGLMCAHDIQKENEWREL